MDAEPEQMTKKEKAALAKAAAKERKRLQDLENKKIVLRVSWNFSPKTR